MMAAANDILREDRDFAKKYFAARLSITGDRNLLKRLFVEYFEERAAMPLTSADEPRGSSAIGAHAQRSGFCFPAALALCHITQTAAPCRFLSRQHPIPMPAFNK